MAQPQLIFCPRNKNANKALIQHVFGVSDQETDLVRILKFRSPNRFTVLYKITSWTGDLFSVCGWRDVKILDIDDSLFLKKYLVGGHKIFKFDCSYVVLLCNPLQRNSTMVSFFSLFTMHQNMQHEKYNIKTNK